MKKRISFIGIFLIILLSVGVSASLSDWFSGLFNKKIQLAPGECYWSPDPSDSSRVVKAQHNELMNMGSYTEERLLCYNGKWYASKDDWNYWTYWNKQTGFKDEGKARWGIIVPAINEKIGAWEVVESPFFGKKWVKKKIVELKSATIEARVCDGYVDIICVTNDSTHSLEPWYGKADNLQTRGMDILWDRTIVNPDKSMQAVFRVYVNKDLSGNYELGCWINNLREDTDILRVEPYPAVGKIVRNVNLRCDATNIACSSNSACGTDGFFGDVYCRENDVYQYHKEYLCNNAGTPESSCSEIPSLRLKEDCAVTCENGVCVNEDSVIILSPSMNSIIESDSEIRWQVSEKADFMYYLYWRGLNSDGTSFGEWNEHNKLVSIGITEIKDEGNNIYSLPFSIIEAKVRKGNLALEPGYYEMKLKLWYMFSPPRLSAPVKFYYKQSPPDSPSVRSAGADYVPITEDKGLFSRITSFIKRFFRRG